MSHRSPYPVPQAPLGRQRGSRQTGHVPTSLNCMKTFLNVCFKNVQDHMAMLVKMQKCLGPDPNLLTQTVWRWNPEITIFSKLPGGTS